MKRTLKLLIYPVIFMGIILFTVSNCKKDSSSKSDATCVDTDDGCGGTFKTCCSSTQCYYQYKGTTYNCDGTDCYSAASDLTSAILANCAKKSTGDGSAITKEQINAKAKEVLQQTGR